MRKIPITLLTVALLILVLVPAETQLASANSLQFNNYSTTIRFDNNQNISDYSYITIHNGTKNQYGYSANRIEVLNYEGTSPPIFYYNIDRFAGLDKARVTNMKAIYGYGTAFLNISNPSGMDKIIYYNITSYLNTYPAFSHNSSSYNMLNKETGIKVYNFPNNYITNLEIDTNSTQLPSGDKYLEQRIYITIKNMWGNYESILLYHFNNSANTFYAQFIKVQLNYQAVNSQGVYQFHLTLDLYNLTLEKHKEITYSNVIDAYVNNFVDISNFYLSYYAYSPEDDNYQAYLDIDRVDIHQVAQGELPAPQNLNAVATTKPSVKLSWSPVGGATCYAIYRDNHLIGYSKTATYEDTGVNYGETYTYYVKAEIKPNDYYDCGQYSIYYPEESQPSESKQVTVPNLPPPTNLKIFLNRTSNNKFYIHLSWTGVEDITYYNIYKYYTDSSGENKKIIIPVSGTKYDDYDINYNTVYYYTVTSYNPDKNAESQKSNEVTIYVPLASPTLNVSYDPNIQTVYLEWTEVAGADHYIIYKGLYSGGEQEIATVEGTSYIDKSVQVGKTYYYYVQGLANGKKGLKSNEVSIFISAPHTYPNPYNLQGKVKTDGNSLYVQLSWTGVSGASYYKVYRGTKMGDEVFIGQTQYTYYNDYGILKDRTYYYYVVAVYNNSIVSGHSNEIKIYIELGQNSQPANVNPPEKQININTEEIIIMTIVLFAIIIGLYALKRRK